MRAIIVTLAGGLLLANANADVFPSCGKRELHSAKAGEACGGPFVCSEGTVCATLDDSIEMPGYTSSYVCTKACKVDSDCNGLSIPMRCTAKGRVERTYSIPSELVCIPTIAKSKATTNAAERDRDQ